MTAKPLAEPFAVHPSVSRNAVIIFHIDARCALLALSRDAPSVDACVSLSHSSHRCAAAEFRVMRRLGLAAACTLIHTALPFQAAPQQTPQQTRRRTQRSATAADWRERCDADGVVSYYDFGVRLHNEHAAAAPKQSATSSFAKALD